MSKKGITNSILTILMFIVMAFVVIDCQADAGSMNGSQSIYFGNLHWTQILLSLGAGLIIGKSGFISTEVEHVNYGGNKFGYDEYPEAQDEINGEIKDQLRPVTNVRIGGELVFDALRFRAGYGILPSLFQNDDTRGTVMSAGVGFRKDEYFLDLAYRRTSVTETYYPYITADAPLQEVENKYSFGNLVFTLGVKF